MKRILWVTDFNFDTNLGGSQKTDFFFIEEAKKRGHEIRFFNHNSERSVLNDSYDLVVSANLEQMIIKKKKYILHYIQNHKNHVRIEHDANEYLDQKDREKLFKSSKINFFLSDFHYETFISMYGNIIDKYEIATPYIDSAKFYDKGAKRENKILYAGFLHTWKGSNLFLEYAINNQDKHFVISGWGNHLYCDRIKKIKNIDFVGKTSHDKMPELFNSYKTLWYHPIKYEPFCRSVAEAMFCGMELDCSSNIGVIHDWSNYGLDGLKEKSKNSPIETWNKIEAELKW